MKQVLSNMSAKEIDTYYQTILELVSLAGKMNITVHMKAKKDNTVREGFSITKRVETKGGPADLVTEFDQRVEEILIKKLKEKFPTHKISFCSFAINKQLILGVIYNPILEHLYSAILGKGAFKNGRPIKCSGQTEL
ncbi:unnamed protein product [Adineta ricciae]|uniref:Uncharacterized protein n=1 Tax=Adineta ricciae TaxID=249248 RepID=A0A815QIB7_ADIRI|nr:unnamed protein product [Adineta ricciae]